MKEGGGREKGREGKWERELRKVRRREGSKDRGRNGGMSRGREETAALGVGNGCATSNILICYMSCHMHMYVCAWGSI